MPWRAGKEPQARQRHKPCRPVYKVGYRVNDAYDTCRDSGAPAQLTRAQVAKIKAKNSGAPIEIRSVKLDRGGRFERRFDLREKNVVLITLKRQP